MYAKNRKSRFLFLTNVFIYYIIEVPNIMNSILEKFELLFVPSQKNDYRPGFLQSKILLYFVILLFTIKLAAIGVSVGLPKNIFFADITRNALTNFVNQGRLNVGLQPLVENQKLDQAAELKAQDMMQKGYFSHQSPEGTTPWFWFREAGYNYKYAGENLAIGFINSEEVYDAWYNSASHRQNILNPNYKEIGTAVLNGFGANKTIIVVQLFGSLEKVKTIARAPEIPAKIVPQNSDKKEITENSPEPENQFVLSQSTEAADRNNPYLKYLNFVKYNYEEIIQNIIYGFVVITGAALLLNIFINFNVQRSDLILRALVIIIVLLSTGVINKDIIVQIIPHKMLI